MKRPNTQETYTDQHSRIELVQQILDDLADNSNANIRQIMPRIWRYARAGDIINFGDKQITFFAAIKRMSNILDKFKPVLFELILSETRQLYIAEHAKDIDLQELLVLAQPKLERHLPTAIYNNQFGPAGAPDIEVANFNRDIHIIVRRLRDLDTQNVDQAIDINRDLMLLEEMGFVLPILRRFLGEVISNDPIKDDVDEAILLEIDDIESALIGDSKHDVDGEE